MLAAALAAGVGLRIAVAAGLPVFPVVHNTWDSTFYHQTAVSLETGQGFTFQGRPTAYFPPAFPFALAAVYRIAGPDPGAGQTANVVFSCALLAALTALAGMLLGRRGAMWTAILAALEPSQIVMPAFLMSETLCAALVTGFFLGLLRWMQTRSWIALVAAALCGAGAGFTRGHAFLLLPAVIAAAAPAGCRPRRVVIALLVVGTVSAGAVGLWSERNRRALGSRVPVATNAGINLLLGNNPEAGGGRADPPGGLPETGDEVRDEREARDRAWTYIREHPGRTLALLPAKAARLWAFGPALTYRVELREKLGAAAGGAITAAAQIAHLGLLAGLAVFLFRGRRDGGTRRWLWWSVAAGLTVWTLGHLPFLGGARYLFPVQPLLIVASAAALTRNPDAA